MHPDHPFAKGSVPVRFVERLQQHLESAVQFCHIMGAHLCEFCPEPTHPPESIDEMSSVPESPPTTTVACSTCGGSFPEPEAYCGQCGAARPLDYMVKWGLRGATGYRNVWIPAANAVYIAPEMILHYIRGHSYRPPDEFVEAVLVAPDQGSEDYMALIGQFQPPFDSLFFDRNAWANREESAWGQSLWSVFGRCAVCGKFVYLYQDEEPPVHCGQPLLHFTRRHYDAVGRLLAETAGGHAAPTGSDQDESGEGALRATWTAKGMCSTCHLWVYAEGGRKLPKHCGKPVINVVHRGRRTGRGK